MEWEYKRIMLRKESLLTIEPREDGSWQGTGWGETLRGWELWWCRDAGAPKWGVQRG